jgi:CHAT domain-containing protein
MLLEPLGGLAAKRLVVVADGALHFVPFAALPVPGRQEPLLLEHEVVKQPSLQALRALRAKPERAARPGSVALLADAVLQPNDPRLGGAPAAPPDAQRELLRSASDGGRIALERLPYTRDEALAIAELVSPAARLQALDFDASRETALSPELARYKIVHFATHALVNDRQPALSGLVLSLFDRHGQHRDGFLRLHDVYNLRLRAELVVLSACRTALGAEVRGEGLVGLTRGFMYAGAPRVVASLWDVQDRATAELMKRFYARMLQHGETPAAALRSAQLALLSDPRFSSPHAWAGFELIGEWR